MAIRMIFFDLDGTLIGDDYVIPKENILAVREAARRGVPSVIATGRMYRSALMFSKELGLSLPLITYNGAVVRKPGGEIVSSSYIEPTVAERVMGYAFSSGWYVQLYSGDGLYYAEQTERARLYESASKVSGEAVGRAGMLARTEDVPKLLVVAPDSSMTAKIAKRINERFRNEAEAVPSSSIYVEVIRPGVSKARAMLSLANAHGVSADEIMALGDSGNDISMIKAAGLGIAMKNAKEEVKAVSDEVSPFTAEEGGVADAIYRHVLNA